MKGLLSVVGGALAGAGEGWQKDIDAAFQERLRERAMQFQAEQGQIDREFRAGEAEKGREHDFGMFDKRAGLEREGWSRADARAAAGRTPSSRFASTFTGADGVVYGITREGTAEPIMAGEEPLRAPARPVDARAPSTFEQETAWSRVQSLPNYGDMTPAERDDAYRRVLNGMTRGAPQGAPQPQGQLTPDEQDISMLRANPAEMRAAFDEAFGPGAADRVLGEAAPQAPATPQPAATNEPPAEPSRRRSGGLLNFEQGTPSPGRSGRNSTQPEAEPTPPREPNNEGREQIIRNAVRRSGGVDRWLDATGEPLPSAQPQIEAMAGNVGMTPEQLVELLRGMRGER